MSRRSVAAVDPKRALTSHIMSRFFVRFHISLILAWSFSVGLLTTKFLLLVHAESLWVRYPLTVLVSYIAFLLGIRVWLWYAGFSRHFRRRDVEIPDNFPDGGHVGNCSPDGVENFSGGGGEFSGGGASDSFSILPDKLPDLGVDLSGADIGEGIVPVLVLILIAVAFAVVFGSAIYVINIAPEILVEAAFEAALAGGLVRAAHRVDDPGWVSGAVNASWKPFLIVLAASFVIAVAIHIIVPEAKTLGQAVSPFRH